MNSAYIETVVQLSEELKEKRIDLEKKLNKLEVRIFNAVERYEENPTQGRKNYTQRLMRERNSLHQQLRNTWW